MSKTKAVKTVIRFTSPSNSIGLAFNGPNRSYLCGDEAREALGLSQRRRRIAITVSKKPFPGSTKVKFSRHSGYVEINGKMHFLVWNTRTLILDTLAGRETHCSNLPTRGSFYIAVK